ncbi:MAG: heme o synthase [Polyangiaceae bacterium]
MSAGLPERWPIEGAAAPSSADASRRRAVVLSRLADVVALTKPRINVMVVATALGGAWLAARATGRDDPRVLLTALAATALVVGGANALNMYLERDTDALMARTRNRPLPAGRLPAWVALVVGLSLSALALPWLTFAVNAATGLLAAIALLAYVLLYTPLKRRTTASLLIGAVPGAMPPLIGWTAVTGGFEAPGLLLFAVLFFWQVPHFLAIATFRRDDYARAGLKVLPVERGDRVTRWHIVGYLVALVTVSLLLAALDVGGPGYPAAAVLLGAAFLGFGLWGLRRGAGVRWARGLFFFSMIYLVLLLGAHGRGLIARQHGAVTGGFAGDAAFRRRVSSVAAPPPR